MSDSSPSSVPLPPPPDGAASAASGFATSVVGPGDGSVVRLYWTLTHPDPGPGEPLLLVNGLGSPLVAFEPGFVTELAGRGFSVVRFDNRDVGRSDRVVPSAASKEPPYLLADMAADAVAVLDAVGWSTAHVFGQSMGGMIVQQLSIDHPDRLRSIISLMSTTGDPDVGRPSEEAYPALVKPAPRDRAEWLDDRVSTERIWASPDSWNPQVTRAKGELLFDYGYDVDGTGRQFRAILASGSRAEALTRVEVPALVIHGSADTLVHPSGGRHTAEVIPGARYVEIDGYGHDLPAAFWPVLADTVAGFALEESHRRKT